MGERWITLWLPIVIGCSHKRKDWGDGQEYRKRIRKYQEADELDYQ
jgi:hypothetical protein